MFHFVAQPHPHFDYMSPSIENVRLSAVVLPRRLNEFLAILDDEGRDSINRAFQGEALH